jgi:thymidylate synthase/dihydrofolate reductase
MLHNRNYPPYFAHLKMPGPKIELVAAISKNGIIGLNGTLPWNIPEDLRHFRELTAGHVVIMGHNTWTSLPARVKPLPDRINIVLSKEVAMETLPDNVHWVIDRSRSDEFVPVPPEGLRTLIHRLHVEDPYRRFFVIGGAKTYRKFFGIFASELVASALHITHVDKVIADADGNATHFSIPPEYQIASYSVKHMSKEEGCTFQHITYTPKTSEEFNIKPTITADSTYCDLVKDILAHGHQRTDRTGTGTTSVFGRQLRFDISGSIPLLTTKQVPWKAVVKELLWFLRGDTDASKLAADGVRIWDGNTSREFLDSRDLGHLPEGDIGAGYGFQWRHFGGTYQTCKETYDNTIGYDQVAAVLDQLRTDPFSRRIFMSAWNPAALGEMALPPCHVSAQFYVEQLPSGRRLLSCHMYQRSVDTFLGLPFNIMSYATLTHILATLTNMHPKELVISTGDTHIYSDHVEQVKTQCQRIPYSSPLLVVNPDIADKGLEEITVDDFDVVGYFHHGVLKGKMAV